MKIFAILLVFIVGMVYSASLEKTNPQCSICKASVDWIRSNENVLSAMKSDEQLSQDVIGVIESDRSAQSVCGLLAMCEHSDETGEFLSNVLVRVCVCRNDYTKGRHCVCYNH